MSLKTLEPPNAENHQHPEISPFFRKKLPEIVEGICKVDNVIRPELAEAEVLVSQVQDYLAFEIEKTRLRLETLQWQDRSSSTEIESTKNWLTKLRDLESHFPSEGVRASQTFLSDLKKILEEEFDA